MRVNILLFIILLSSLSLSVFSQNGSIRGAVFDGKTGEFLPGVTVFIEGTTKGTITDLDGEFDLSLAPGDYQVRISFISYNMLKLNDIIVRSGEVTLLENIQLSEASIEIEEAVVTATAIRNTETAMMTMKRKSVNVIDAISSAGLKKIGDSNAAASMKRVTGVSVQGGKYVFVRGLGDRYTKTILNGLDIPGLDPDRNTIQMDIFPTSIVENIVVNKSFSADLPADFTGGMININLTDFPETKKASVSADAAFNANSHFNDQFLTYEGSKTDFMGFDNGTRAIPATTNIPLFSDVVGSPNSPNGLRYKSILSSFNPELAVSTKRSFLDYGFSASFGNQRKIGKYNLGYIFSASYKNDVEFFKEAEYGRYGLPANIDHNEMEMREKQIGNYSVENVLLSGLAGFALKTTTTKYRINFLHLQNGEKQAGIFDYQKSNLGTEFSGFQHNLEYSQRSLSNLLINGKHAFLASGWDVEWKLSPTFSRISDPDIRFTRYGVFDETYVIGTEVGFPERIWRELEEINLAGVVHFTKNMTINNKSAKLQFGAAYTFKERDYVIRNYALNIRNVPLTGDPNEILATENLWPYNGNVSRGTSYEAPFIPVNPNQFNANTRNTAGYLSFEMSPLKNLKMVAGLRLENFVQYYTGQDQLGYRVLNNDEVLNDFNFFPTLNLIYSINDLQNLRFSFSNTIARPSFKELSFAEIFDPISGRTFIGGMFRDADDILGVEYWDGNLTITNINNFDLRWEMFKENGQTLSTSLFYKQFSKPIEMVQFATQVGSFQPRNVGDGQVLGLEIEFRQNLHFISEKTKDFSLVSNFTFTKSSIELSTTEYQSRVDNARTGQTVSAYRDMAGQAPYIINAGISYNGSEKGFGKGLDVNLFYNVQGPTLEFVGIVDRPDIYNMPFHSLNFNGMKKVGKKEKLQIGLKADNLLNQKKISVFKSYNANDQFFSKLSTGTTWQLKLSYTIF